MLCPDCKNPRDHQESQPVVIAWGSLFKLELGPPTLLMEQEGEWTSRSNWREFIKEKNHKQGFPSLGITWEGKGMLVFKLIGLQHLVRPQGGSIHPKGAPWPGKDLGFLSPLCCYQPAAAAVSILQLPGTFCDFLRPQGWEPCLRRVGSFSLSWFWNSSLLPTTSTMGLRVPNVILPLNS